MKLLTAITLCYNQLSFVEPCINSMRKYKGLPEDDIDYVLYDQGAPYPGVSEFLKSIEEPWISVLGGGFNIGVGAALNNVISNTESQYVLKLDDDCEVLPLTVPLLIIAYALAESCGFPLAVLSADVIGVGKGHVAAEQQVGEFTFEQAWCVGGGAVLISRKVLEDVGPWRADRLYGVEDGDFARRAINKGYVNAYLKDVPYISKCRTPEADPQIDDWKLDYYHHTTDLAFADWRKARAFEKKGYIDKGE